MLHGVGRFPILWGIGFAGRVPRARGQHDPGQTHDDPSATTARPRTQHSRHHHTEGDTPVPGRLVLSTASGSGARYVTPSGTHSPGCRSPFPSGRRNRHPFARRPRARPGSPISERWPISWPTRWALTSRCGAQPELLYPCTGRAAGRMCMNGFGTVSQRGSAPEAIDEGRDLQLGDPGAELGTLGVPLLTLRSRLSV